MIEKFNGCCGPGWTLTTPGGNALQFYAGITVLNAGLSLQTGVWQQFVVTRNGTTFSLYYDGSRVGTGTALGARSPDEISGLWNSGQGSQIVPEPSSFTMLGFCAVIAWTFRRKLPRKQPECTDKREIQ